VVGAEPDVIVVAVGSPHGDAVELCRRLRQEASIAAGTAVVMVAVAPTSLEQRLAGLRAGAWDVLTLPMNAEELLARLDAYVGVKLEADRTRAEGLLDMASGLYAVRGVEYRARELLADASRHHLALACVVLGVDPEPEQQPLEASDPVASMRVVQHVAKALHTHGRLSDVIGRWNHTEFAVLAPGTDAAGAARLAHRLGRAVEASPLPPGVIMAPLQVRAGYEAVEDAGATPLRAQDLLARADTALQKARVDTSLFRVRRYSPDPPYQASP
jgi:diguanylate cyclase (GGDEF)-like protein